MPSWGIHLATAYEVTKKIKIKNKDNFFIGNMLPDAERYVIKDFSIYVPYEKSHFSRMIQINNRMEKLPDYNIFIQKYKKDLNNPIVLGYLTHLIADYYWNYLTFSKYTAVNERGEIIGVLRNENEFLKGGNELRKVLKQKDFANLDKEIVKSGNYQLPSFLDDCMKDLKVIEETTYNSEDILKIIEYLKKMVETKNKEQIDEYDLFTREKIKEYYFKSIEFIVDILSNIDMLS